MRERAGKKKYWEKEGTLQRKGKMRACRDWMLANKVTFRPVIPFYNS